MQKVIIADTSCLILLHKVGEFDLLRALFKEITITSDIQNEFGLHLPDWVVIKDPVNQTQQSIINVTVDKGEASAIALALEEDDPLLILDDLKARRLASNLSLKHTGTLGILADAKLSGHLNKIKPVLDKIKETTSTYLLHLSKRSYC